MNSLVGMTVSHHKILEKLGEGGMGVVYKAEDTKLKRTVALKFLPRGLEAHEPERARFLQEAQAAATLNHPNICTVHDIQEYEPTPGGGSQQYIIMEYVEGRTLSELVPVKKLQEAINYGLQICEALEEAHNKGIVHRDIKTQNIMVNAKNQVKVMDFGLAKLKGSLKLTKATSTVGTLAYMAPEQIQGGEVDARSDIFSFGVVLYEMLAGRPPFQGEHEAAIMYAILNQEPEPLQHHVPDAPSELLHLLSRALEKDPEDRYQNVHEMLIDLRRLKKDSSRVLRQPPPEGTASVLVGPALATARKKVQKKWLLSGAGGLAVLGVVLVLLLLPGTSAVKLNPHRSFRALSVPFERLGYASLSMDGNWLVFPAANDSGRWDVYCTNTAGGEPGKITHQESFLVINADVSPEAGLVAYDRIREPSTPPEIRLVPFQGGVSRTIADTGLAARWRPDGKRIGYVRVGDIHSYYAPSASGKLEIWSVKPDGTDNRLELIDSISARTTPISFCWSPDGESIAWVRNFPEAYGEVMVRELATGRERQLTSERKTVDEVIWATNGNILFVSNRSGCSNIWAIPSGGGEATQVTQGTVPIISARISVDSKKLAYIQEETIYHLWISTLDGRDARQVTSDDIRVLWATFSPDASQIASVIGSVDVFRPETHLAVMDREGRNRRALTSGSQIVDFCRWSFDGKWLAYSSRSVEEPTDSNRVYLIQPSNSRTPRLLAYGSQFLWLDNENLVVPWKMKTWRYSIKGGTPTQVYRDSTSAVPLQNIHMMWFRDERKGREGYWIVPIDSSGADAGEARRIPPPEDVTPYFVGPPDFRFRVYQKPGGNEIWRVWLADGKEERIGTVLPGNTLMVDVTMDGTEILWVNLGARSKPALIENLFEE